MHQVALRGAWPHGRAPHLPLHILGASQFTLGDWGLLGRSMYYGVQSAPQREEVGLLHCAVQPGPRARAISFSKPGNRPTPVTSLPSLPYSFGTTLHRSEPNLKCFCSLLNKHFFHRNQSKLITVQTGEQAPGAEGYMCSPLVGVHSLCSAVPQGSGIQSSLSHRPGGLPTGGAVSSQDGFPLASLQQGTGRGTELKQSLLFPWVVWRVFWALITEWARLQTVTTANTVIAP